MKLPHLDKAIIPENKILGYLLSTTHPAGRHKAAFFTRFGFSSGAWESLAAALLKHAGEHEVSEAVETPFGSLYTVQGALTAPDGRKPVVRSVWFVRKGGAEPVFVTAYPRRNAR